MRPSQHTVCAWAFVVLTAGFAAWAVSALPVWLGAVAVLPLVVTIGFVFRRSVRALVVAGALALPYLAVTIVELIASGGASRPLTVSLAGGLVFLALLVPVTRNAKRAGLSPRR